MKNSQKRGNPVGQNESHTTSKQDVNLRQNGMVYFQVGLIVALLLAIFAIEYKSPVTAYEPETLVISSDNDFVEPIQFKLEEVVPEQPEPPKEKNELLPPIVDDKIEEIDTPDFLDPTPKAKTNEKSVKVTDIKSIPEPIEEINLEDVEFVPIFPGCEGLATNQQRKECLQEGMSKIISKNFDTDAVQDYGVSGVNRINVQFTVDENGNVVNIKSRAANPALEREAERVIKKVPKMKPGIKQGQRVRVIYGQPILFRIDQ